MSGNITVVVRCRPLNSREKARGAKELVTMEGNNTYIEPPESVGGRANDRETKSFAFDKSYWSACPKDDPNYASQETLYNDLGKDLLNHSFEGFNTCIFAYGQTGSGKSYSMMGYGEDRGIIPLICEALFERIIEQTTDTLTYTVEVSYTEIYQEKVRDLLNPSNKGNLKVREHPTLGPYVESLSKLAVQTFADVESLMEEGMKARTVAATNMNETSSRSHAVFTLLLTQRRLDKETGMAGEKVSRISLVDLAGSERANSTGATGVRLKEGALINKSLTTLGRVIAALAVASSAGPGKAAKAAAEKVPYRDSVLTWLLKDSLGGNSKTAMVAAISPADYEETLSTLRYADQAKKIKNKAVVNEDPNARLIRELKEELATLRVRMTGGGSETTYNPDIPAEQQIVQYRNKQGEIKSISKAELQDQLEASEKLMASVTETWEEKLVRTQEVQKERESALEALGITIEKNLVGVSTPKKLPHLVNLNEDPLMAECLLYQIKPGRTVVGNLNSDNVASDIRLSGSSILPEHCHFDCSPEGIVTLHSRPNSTTMVNGQRISPTTPKELHSGFRVILGDFHVFRFNHPEEVRKARDAGAPATGLRSPLLNGFEDDRAGGSSSPATRPESPESGTPIDWSYARREAVVARLNGKDVNLDKLKDEELNRLYSDILKVRHSRTGSSAVGSDRPESRMSFMDSVTEDGDDDDDGASDSPLGRPFSGSTWSTGQTSLGDTTLTLGNAPELDDRLQAVKEQYEERIKTMLDSSNESDEVRAEKLKMEDKVKTLETQMRMQRQRYEKRVKQLKAGEEGDAIFDLTPLTTEQERLARLILAKWRTRRRVRMAEDALSQAVAIKEANVISRELQKGVQFQFVIVERDVPTSGSEAISGFEDIDDVSDAALVAATKPCIGVKVIDRRNKAIYVWSLPKLQRRLQQMRNLYKFIGTEYSQHFSWEDPFYESPPLPGNYSYVGSALVSLAPLSRNLPSTNEVQIFSPYTADPIGTCRVVIKPVSIVTPAAAGAALGNGNGSHPSMSSFVEGAELSVEIAVDRVSGLSKSEFASLHLQISLATFFGPSLAQDEVLPSAPVDLGTTPVGDLRLNRTVSIVLTNEIQQYLASGYAPIEFFGQVQPAHLDKVERWDEARDSSLSSKLANAPPLRGDPLATDVTRRPETELVSEQRHDVMAAIEIRELGETGEYTPVQVVNLNSLDSGAFFLRQGLQRRFVLKLSHNSGRGWLWKRVAKVTLDNVRMLDDRGRLHAATSSVEVELRPTGKSRPVFGADGTATLAFSAPWDSSVHDSPFLNRNTTAGHRSLLRVKWEVEAEGCDAPVVFSMDIAVTVQGRDARPPSKLMSLFSSARMSSRITNLFAIRLTPALTKKPTDIWRLNTAETFVRNEEVLGSWKPRGLSLIRDHDKLVQGGRKTADVEAARAVLAAFELTLPSAADGVERDERLGRVIELWQKQFGSVGEISLDRQEAPSTDMLDLSPSASPNLQSPASLKKLVGSATIVPRTDTAARRGHLAMLRDPTSDKWKKFWFVLRRPYLYLYESSSETHEVTVINVSTVRVEQTPEIEQMLERKFSFAIFTQQNRRVAYFFQAANLQSMIEWIKSIDPSLA